MAFSLTAADIRSSCSLPSPNLNQLKKLDESENADDPEGTAGSSVTGLHHDGPGLPEPLLADPEVLPFADVTNDEATAEHTATVPPSGTPRHQRKTPSIYGTPSAVMTDRQSASSGNILQPPGHVVTPMEHLISSPYRVADVPSMSEMRERALAENAMAMAKHGAGRAKQTGSALFSGDNTLLSKPVTLYGFSYYTKSNQEFRSWRRVRGRT